MNIAINEADISQMNDFVEALENSELGNRYFSEVGSARKSLEEGIKNDYIYSALDSDGKCVGFVWVIQNGIFHSFPYIHIIAVKKEARGQGIGKLLLKHVEDVYFEKKSKLFLVVADFNPDAKRLYQEVGYTIIGDIPSLYRNGISECLMMKARK